LNRHRPNSVSVRGLRSITVDQSRSEINNYEETELFLELVFWCIRWYIGDRRKR